MMVREFIFAMPSGSAARVTQTPEVKEITWDAIYVAEEGTLGGVTGHVYDIETGDPIEGVMVSFQLQSDQTDFEGYYELGEIPAGPQTFMFVKGGYKVAQRDATIVADDWITLDVQLTPGEGPEPPPEPPNLLWLWLLLGASGAAIVGIQTKKLLDKDKRS